MDVEAKKRRFVSRKWRNVFICLGFALILLTVLLVILAFTVFKSKDPVITVDSVDLNNLNLRLDVTRVAVNLNLTVAVNLTVENPNKVGMKYKDSVAVLTCRGEQVGEIPIPAGEVSADETVRMLLYLTVMADRLVSNPRIFSDIVSGSLPLSTYTKISGKVPIFNAFNVHVISVSNCSFIVYISNRTTSEELCTYKNSL